MSDAKNSSEPCGDCLRLRAEVNRLREDLAAAAGLLMVPIQEPGTDMCRVLMANSLLRQENERLLSVRTQNRIDRLLSDLNDIAQDWDVYTDTLPLDCVTLTRMRQAVLEWLRTAWHSDESEQEAT